MFLRVTGAYMDWSSPDHVESRLSGCGIDIGTVCVPQGADAHHPWPHAVYYPLEGSALYICNAQGPTRKRYVLRHFILGYPNGAFVVGWYHDRILDVPAGDVSMNDLHILSRDTRVNVSTAALHARAMTGLPIMGPVWYGAFNPQDLVHLGPQWNNKPSFVVHGWGWRVPSWVFELKHRAALLTHKPHDLPKDSVTSAAANSTQKKRYLTIQPRPEKDPEKDPEKQVGCRGHAAEEAKAIWQEASASRLAREEDQKDKKMPLYYDYSAVHSLCQH